MNGDDLGDLRGVELTTHLFQEYVPREFEVRLTVVGNECFAAKIAAESSANPTVDWRRDYDSHTYKIVDVPDAVRSGVLTYMDSAGLAFGAFDFVVTPHQEWFTLECNPEGQWGWIEEKTDLPISDTIAGLLLQDTA